MYELSVRYCVQCTRLSPEQLEDMNFLSLSLSLSLISYFLCHSTSQHIKPHHITLWHCVFLLRVSGSVCKEYQFSVNTELLVSAACRALNLCGIAASAALPDLTALTVSITINLAT